MRPRIQDWGVFPAGYAVKTDVRPVQGMGGKACSGAAVEEIGRRAIAMLVCFRAGRHGL